MLEVYWRWLGWRVEDGRSISIWNNCWLPSPGVPCIINTLMTMQVYWVRDLFLLSATRWNVDLVSQLFSVDEATRILCVPLVSSESVDFMVWSGDPTGCYSVKSRYHQLQASLPLPSIPPSS